MDKKEPLILEYQPLMRSWLNVYHDALVRDNWYKIKWIEKESKLKSEEK